MLIAPTVQIASLGMADSFILMVMALVVFGPRRLPQIGRQIGKLMYEFRKASNDFKFQMEEELRNAEEADRRKKEEERLRALALAAPAPTAAPALLEATSPTDAPAYPANYDNGPIASSQAASTSVADTAPTIRPPSTGDPIEAARAWSLDYELAKLAEAKTAADPAANAPNEPLGELSTPPHSDSTQPEVSATGPATASTAIPEAAAHDSTIAVNHHG
jgi:sec-independent protein translocase protein TatB